MNSDSERRTETRLQQDTTIFVEVCSASIDDDSPGNVVICNSLDISANGVQVQMDQEVPIGSILRLCADPGIEGEELYLVGEVKWIGRDNEFYNIGFALFDAENSDIVGWKKLIASKLNDH